MKYIAYYRCSTREQETSHLGLDAQRQTVLNYIHANGNQLIAEFTEVESGRNNQRPELLKAIALAKEEKARLVISRLDRLSRSVSLVTTLNATKVDFVCCDMPLADKTTIYVIAAFAEREAELISTRTKEGLQALTARDPHWKDARPYYDNIGDAGRRKGYAALRRNAREDKSIVQAWTVIKPLREQIPPMSFQRIADTLNAGGFLTYRGNKFFKRSVYNIWKRFAAEEDAL